MKKCKRVIGFALAGCMVLSLTLTVPPVKAYGSEVDDWNEQLAASEDKLDELQGKIDATKKEKDKALEAKALLDERNEVLQDQITTVKAQIDETSKRIAENEAQEKAQYEIFCKQVRQEEERGPVSYWSVLFKATSFADLLSRADFINEIMEHDQQVINDLQTIRTQLDKDREALEAQQAVLNDSQAELESQIAEANSIVNDLASTAEGLQKMYDEEEAEGERIQAMIDDYYSQHGDVGGGGTSGGSNDTSTQDGVLSGLIWPTNQTRYITSKFGPRVPPVPGASSYHPGIDIGVPYGTDVYASQDGVVIQAGWNGGYGISVIIAHPNGVTTLYGHMCDWLVSEGQTVSRGQVIGLVGSTGNSSGPHIHMEVRINGTRVDPLSYLDGNYIPYWD